LLRHSGMLRTITWAASTTKRLRGCPRIRRSRCLWQEGTPSGSECPNGGCAKEKVLCCAGCGFRPNREEHPELPASSGRTGQSGNRVCQSPRGRGDGGRDGSSFRDDHLRHRRIGKVARRGACQKWDARAKLEGRQIGRARLDVNREQVVRDRRSGMSLTQVAKKHRISRASVCRLMKEASSKPDAVPALAGSLPEQASAAGAAQ
jgi:hypothetical protein